MFSLRRFVLAATALLAILMLMNICRGIPINQFDPEALQRDVDTNARQLLLNSVRYNVGWLHTIEGAQFRNEYPTRSAASAAYAIATAIRGGIYDPQIIGISEREAQHRVKRTIRAVAGQYTGWGRQWQSALWMTYLANAAWLIWDELDGKTQELIVTALILEADRFIEPGYRIPFWSLQNGTVITPGDSKAEENAWNAAVLQMAVAMLPNHEHAEQWRKVRDDLMQSAFASQSDGLAGWNVNDDFTLVNHNRIHPDYMATVSLNLRTITISKLAEQETPRYAEHNAAAVYQKLKSFYLSDGTIDYPTATDWSNHRIDIFWEMDAYASALWNDKQAAQFAEVRAERLLAMQGRHADGRLYSDGEFDNYLNREQLAIQAFADVWLLLILR